MMKYIIVISLLIAFYACRQNISEKNKYPELPASIETQPVSSKDDAADDPAIWIHPSDLSLSKIIGTNKQRGLSVYDLNGKELFSYDFGKINNVDVRYNFPVENDTIDIVGGSNRTNNSLSLFSIDGNTGELKEVHAREIICKMSEVYGFGFYHNKKKDKFYAIITGKDGEVEQYELYASEKGLIDAKPVRSFDLGSQSEGVVADDENQVIFIAEEKGNIWKLYADPETGDDKQRVADLGNENLTPDIEGLAIYYGEGNSGYLIASSQGDNSYAVFERGGSHLYIGSFRITDGENVDGTEDTDGIDVMNLGMNETLKNGFFIAQDGKNLDDGKKKNQNFKIVKWEKIANKFEPGLLIDNKYNIR